MKLSQVAPVLVALFATVGAAPDLDGLATMKEFVGILNSGDHSRMKAFIDKTFVQRPNNEATLSGRADRLLSLGSQGSPLTITKVLIDKKNKIVVQVEGVGGAIHEIKLNFQEVAPFRATSIYMGGPGSQSGPDPKTYSTWKDLPDLLSQIKVDTGVPALGMAVYKDGKILSAVVGERELGKAEKARLEDRWLIGSITKSMTATMIARLVEKGLLRWDMTLSEALPNTPMRAEYRAVTLLQILHHRSGIPQDRYVNPEFLEKAAGTETNPVQMREHYAQFTLNRDPIAKPDEKMLYSNAGYSMAAHMAETAAKKPYEALMKELVFGPLHMKSARFGVPGSPGNPGAPGQLMGHVVQSDHLRAGVLDEPKLVGIQSAAGIGLSMTLEDLLRFVRFNLDGLQAHPSFLGPANFQVLHRPAVDTPGQQKYACGWLIEEGLTRESYHGHNGSDGTFRAEMAIWPEHNLAMVAIANAGARSEPPAPLQAIIAAYNRFVPVK